MNRLHLSELRIGRDRERLQLEEWAFGNGRDFLESLGLTGGWWCALNMPRRELFDERSGGDVDLLAGPLGLRISEHEFRLMVADASRAAPSRPPRMHVNAALVRAGTEGMVQWPPNIGYTIGVEVKASYYDGEKWKASHTGEKEKLLGSLRMRRTLGINQVVLMHLGVVVPMTSVDDMDRMAEEAGRSFPLIFEGNEVEPAGYYRHLMTGVERAGNMVWGAEGGSWICYPEQDVLRCQPWHQTLKERFAALPRPEFFRTYIVRCRSCGQWRHSHSANSAGLSCSCGHAW